MSFDCVGEIKYAENGDTSELLSTATIECGKNVIAGCSLASTRTMISENGVDGIED